MGKGNDTSKSDKKKSKSTKQAMNAKMLAIAIIFVLLFVSFAVIITTQEGTQLSKNMVFRQDAEESGSYYGNVKDVNIDLSNVKIEIKDASSDSTNTSDTLADDMIMETAGNFKCTFSDKNHNGKLDSADEFFVQNAAEGDLIKLYLKSSNTELAFYTFSAPF